MVHWFLAQNIDRSALSPLFDTACAALMAPREAGGWAEKVEDLFGGLWLAGLQLCHSGLGSGGQLMEMLRSIACRCMEKDWVEDLRRNPKLCVLNSVHMNGPNRRCMLEGAGEEP